MNDPKRQRLEGKFETYELICKQLGQAELEMSDTEWCEGYLNGLKEARNRVEEAIMNEVGDSE